MIFSYAIANGSKPISLTYEFGQFRSIVSNVSSSNRENAVLLNYNKNIGSATPPGHNQSIGFITVVTLQIKETGGKWSPHQYYNAFCDNQVHEIYVKRKSGLYLKFGYACGPLPTVLLPATTTTSRTTTTVRPTSTTTQAIVGLGEQCNQFWGPVSKCEIGLICVKPPNPPGIVMDGPGYCQHPSSTAT